MKTLLLAAIICLFVDEDNPPSSTAPLSFKWKQGGTREAFRSKMQYVKVGGQMVYLMRPEDFQHIKKLYPEAKAGETTLICYAPE